MPAVKDPDGGVWRVRRRASPRVPRGAEVFEWVDLFGIEPDRGRERSLRVAVGLAVAITVLVVVTPQALARAAPLLVILLLAFLLTVGRALFGIPTIVEARRQEAAGEARGHRGGRSRDGPPAHIAVRARGWKAGRRAERDVCAALREGYNFR